MKKEPLCPAVGQRALPAICLLAAAVITTSLATAQAAAKHPQRNVIIFVADGLRYGSVNEKDTPALWNIRKHGVDFQNGHSLFPTFTTANASAIATGHGFGDTGDYSNTIYVGYKLYASPSFHSPGASITPFLENDEVLSDVAAKFGGNYLGEPTLLGSARAAGYNVASVGKLGPTAIQQIEAVAAKDGGFPHDTSAIILDDATGTPAGMPLPADLIPAFQEAGLAPVAPGRNNGYPLRSSWDNGNGGNAGQPGTLQANVVQGQWFADATTRVLLPRFAARPGKGFVLLFWSRDPDGTQHNEGDSLQTLTPGINGPSPTLALRNADHNLQQILDWLDKHPAIKSRTDIFITSDHGFATISRRELDAQHKTAAPSSQLTYTPRGVDLPAEPAGTLPTGFLAIDLALGLHTHLFEPLRATKGGPTGPYAEISLDPKRATQPISGSAILGDHPAQQDGSDALAIVASNGGSDLVYVPTENKETVKKIVTLLTALDYVGGIFVDKEKYGDIDGTLSLADIGLKGASKLPRPAIVVAFKVFYQRAGDLQSAAQISDTTLEEGQGMHGGFGRESTLNNMAAIGPDFKAGYADTLPASNMDIVPTLASILDIQMSSTGSLRGRLLQEALKGSAQPVAPKRQVKASQPSANGFVTVLEFQEFKGQSYNDRGCFVSAKEQLKGCGQ